MRYKLLIFTLLISILINTVIPTKVCADIVKKEDFVKISIDEGLSNEYVTTIFQDSKGYMWIGTKDGLNRYDGEKIKIYNCKFEDKNSLSSTYIFDVEEDSHGNIWIATDHGLNILIRDTDNVIRMKDIPNDNYNLGYLKITALLKSSYNENIMWVGTENGLIKIDIETQEIEAFYGDKNDMNSLTNSSITCIKEGKNGELWVGTKDGINVLDKDFKIVYRQIEVDNDKLYIYYLEIDESGNVWISTKEGIIVYDLRKLENVYLWMVDNNGIKKYDIKEKKIVESYEYKKEQEFYNNNFILLDSEKTLWISSSDGILKYYPGQTELNIIKKDEKFKNSLSSNVVTCFYEDFNGTIWVGTDKLLNILNKNNQFNSVEEQIYLNNKNIVSILKDDSYLWIATKYDGIYIYDKKTSNLLFIIYDNDNGINIKNQHIKSLYKLNEKWIIVITNKGIISIDREDYTYDHHFIEDGYSSEINYLYSDEENIWLASTSSFYSYNFNTGETTYYDEDLIKFNIKPGGIKYILPDYKDENIIWLGGVNTGLVKYHKEKGVIEQYTQDSFNNNFFIDNYINCMTFDNLGNLWIGTNVGLSKFDLSTEKVTVYTTVHGLSNNFINSILVDDSNNLWISTNKGLNKFDIQGEKIANFNKSDGLYGYQFNLNSSVKLENGVMIFGSTNGVTFFYPNNIITFNKNKNEVVIGDIFIGQNKVLYDGEELVLEYNDKDLSIDYFLPDYEELNNISYEYILEGIDSNWIYIDSKSSLSFKSLEPGKYILKLRARYPDGDLTKETSINIRVKNPVWKTPLAYLTYIILLTAIIVYVFNYVKILQRLVDQKTKKINNQLEENKRLSKEIIDKEKFKNNFFVNLSHELRTPINVISATVQLVSSLISSRTMTYEKAYEYIDIINKNCGNLLKIINDIIDTSKIETGHYIINKENNDIVYVVEEAALNMKKFIEEKGISLIIDPYIEEKIISFDSTEIERVVINLLANAVKFTPEGGEIIVFIKEVNNYIEITVEDNGIGISKEDQEFIFKRFSQVEGTGTKKASSSGIGLTLVKYIVELHNGYVRLESEPNKGSKFTVGLPDIIE